ncbi:septal ring lytic transglycosylase RlpA family protein [Ramlibacter sp. AW1]|uniref:Endolytic peptidoglycan transglycosylase RlpA n=1 Tax=Ramlibacter aurantiacus TaxID=2801330 RepID=A0A936ZR50_9BURK|nr:septal ring lytic transglycosylase RlpA family protein [Ramlibacter aurantiacus]MBL0421953.1 septal ring lytic transglycosylase RlpA family protein [Ramlibacter aurantiacus]
MKSARFLVPILLAGPLAAASAWGHERERHAASTPSEPKAEAASKKKKLDHSGRRQVGKASFYHDRFGGRKMANGEPMELDGDNAASRTLPLGTTARVTNLETGQSTVVTIEDRGPYVDGRIVDLSPASADEIGLSREQGLAEVEVAPIEVPMPDGTTRMGAGAAPERGN